MSESLGLSIGTANLVAARPGRAPVSRRAVLTLWDNRPAEVGVPELIVLSRRTASTLWTNIAIAILVKVVFFALAIGGIATLWMAVFADMGASLLVAANGLRLLGTHPARGSDH